MTHWTAETTQALSSAEVSLKTVGNLLSFVNDGQGKPSAGERAIFAAAVVFLYGTWENYVEQLAIELVGHIANEVSAEKVPDQVRKSLEKKSAWELAIHPGWKALWIQSVRLTAVGDDDERFGMNTARAGQVKNLLVTAGAVDPFSDFPEGVVPTHLGANAATVPDAVNKLVELRGEIVHTGKVPSALRKYHVLEWQTFVATVCKGVDQTVRNQCKRLSSS